MHTAHECPQYIPTVYLSTSLATVVIQSIMVSNRLTLSTSLVQETLTIYKLCSCALIHTHILYKK